MGGGLADWIVIPPPRAQEQHDPYLPAAGEHGQEESFGVGAEPDGAAGCTVQGLGFPLNNQLLLLNRRSQRKQGPWGAGHREQQPPLLPPTCLRGSLSLPVKPEGQDSENPRQGHEQEGGGLAESVGRGNTSILCGKIPNGYFNGKTQTLFLLQPRQRRIPLRSRVCFVVAPSLWNSLPCLPLPSPCCHSSQITQHL